MTFEEDEPELADLEFVAVAEQHPIDALLIDIGAVERTGVGHHVALRGPFDLGVSARDRDVVEADLGFGMTTEPRDVFVQREPGAGLGAGTDDQDADFVRKLADGDDDVVVVARGILQRVEGGECDRAIVERVER